MWNTASLRIERMFLIGRDEINCRYNGERIER